MAVHPCCGGSLQTGATVVAIVQMILAIVALTSGVVIFLATGIFVSAAASAMANDTLTPTNSSNGMDRLGHNNNSPTFFNTTTNGLMTVNYTRNSTDTGYSEDTVAIISAMGIVLIVSASILILRSFISLGLAILLLVGARNRHARKCRIWLIVKCIVMVIGSISYMASFHGNGRYENSIGFAELILNGYCLWVVYEFINELNDGEKTNIGRNIYGETNFKA